MFKANLPLCVCRLASHVKPRTVGSSDHFSKFFYVGIATVVLSTGVVLLFMVEGCMIACHEKPQDSPCKCRAGSNHLENTKKQTSNHPQGVLDSRAPGEGESIHQGLLFRLRMCKSITRKMKAHKTEPSTGSRDPSVSAGFDKGPPLKHQLAGTPRCPPSPSVSASTSPRKSGRNTQSSPGP